MLLSEFVTNLIIGAGTSTAQHLRGRQNKQKGFRMRKSVGEGAILGAGVGGLNSARTLGRQAALVGAVGGGLLGAGHGAIGHAMGKKTIKGRIRKSTRR